MGGVKRSSRILLKTTSHRCPSSLCSRIVYQAHGNMASITGSGARSQTVLTGGLMTGVIKQERLAGATWCGCHLGRSFVPGKRNSSPHHPTPFRESYRLTAVPKQGRTGRRASRDQLLRGAQRPGLGQSAGQPAGKWHVPVCSDTASVISGMSLSLWASTVTTMRWKRSHTSFTGLL